MIFPGESDWKFKPPQRSRVFGVDVPDLPGIGSSLSVAFDRLATSDDEVHLAVSLLECTIGVAPFGRWRRRPLLLVAILAIVVILVTSVITSVIVTIITVIIATISLVVVTPVIAVIATVVIASVIMAVVAAIIMSIPILVARIGPTVMVISSIRSTVMIVEALTTIAVVVVVAPGLLGGRWYSKGTL
jgi:hypothetical protein